MGIIGDTVGTRFDAAQTMGQRPLQPERPGILDNADYAQAYRIRTEDPSVVPPKVKQKISWRNRVWSMVRHIAPEFYWKHTRWTAK
jgi:hypothetical protein